MAGYRKKSTLYTLKWAEGHDLHGLEVTMKGLSVDAMLRITSIASALVRPGDLDEKVAKADELFRLLSGKLVSWNLEDEDGTPVPATHEGLVSLDDLPFILNLVTTWMEQVASVDSPLPSSSASGPSTGIVPAMEVSLPMESSSLSPGS